MEKKICVLLAVLLALPMLAGFTGEAEYNGYLLKLRPGANICTVFSERDVLEPVTEDVYRTEDAGLIRELTEAGLVLCAEPDYLVELYETPNDPCLTSETNRQYVPEMIGLEYAWNAGITGASVRVGIVDSGLYTDHEDLDQSRLVPGWNYCDENDDTSDEVGHGTFVAGVIAARTGNGLGVAGIAPGVELVPLKCFTTKKGQTSDIVKAIRGGVDTFDCDVLNMSFGLFSDSEFVRDAVEYAAQRGVLMAAASGNLDGGVASTGHDRLNYPAAYSSVVGVGAVDANGSAAAFSYQNESVWVCAPGVNVIGLGIGSRSHYYTSSGTSFATPVVSAMAALALSVDPGLTIEGFQALLRDTAADRGQPGYDTAYGYGVVNAGRFLRTLRGETGEDGAYAYLTGLAPQEQVLIVQAAYDGTGRMLDVVTETVRADGNGILCVSGFPVRKAEGAVRGRLMMLDSSLCPLRAATPVSCAESEKNTPGEG